MDFDLASAKPIDSQGFDLSSATPINQAQSSTSVPMSQAKNLPPTWSPTVKGQKLNAVYDPDARAYITTDYGLSQKIVRQKDGSLDLVEHKPSTASMVKDVAVDTGKRTVGAITRGVLGLPALAAQGYGEIYNTIAPDSAQIPRENLPANYLHQKTVDMYGQPDSYGETALEFASGAGGMAKAAGKGAEKLAELGVSPRTQKALAWLAASPKAQVAAGAGGGLAAEKAKREGYGGVGQFIASLAGGLATAAVPAAVRGAANVLPQSVENTVAKELLANSSNPERDIALLQAEAQRVANQETQGLNQSKATTGQVLAQQGDVKQLAMEKQLQANEVSAHRPLTERYQSNADVRNKELVDIAPASNGAQSVVDTVKSAYDKAQQNIDAANQKAALIRDETGNNISDLEAGSVIRPEIEKFNRVERDKTSSVFESVDPKDKARIPVNTKELSDFADSFYAGLKLTTPSEVKQALAKIKEAVDSNATPSAKMSASLAGRPSSDVMTYNQIRVISSHLGEIERYAAAHGQDQLETAMKVMKHKLRANITEAAKKGNIEKDVADRYNAAINQKLKEVDLFGKYAMKDALRVKGDSSNTLHTEYLPSRLLNGNAENFRSFQKAMGDSPVAQRAAKDWIATQWKKTIHKPSDGSLQTNWREKSAKFIDSHDEVFKAYPDLLKKIKDAEKQSIDAENRALIHNKMVASKTGDRQFLRDADADYLFDKFIKSNNRENDVAAIKKITTSNSKFKEDFKGALREHLQSLKDDASRVQFLDDPSNQKMITHLFGEETAKRLEAVKLDAKRDLLIEQKGLPSSSIKQKQALTPADLATYVATGGQGVAVKKIVEHALKGRALSKQERIDTLRTESALDTGKAAKLMQSKQSGVSGDKGIKRGALGGVIQFLPNDKERKEDLVNDSFSVKIKKILGDQ